MIHKQLSRRNVLATGISAGTALVQTWNLQAAGDVDALRFIIVTDTHLGRNDNDRSERQWRQAIAEINDLEGEFVLHLGDVVDRGREAQYPIYAKTRKLLNKPIHEIPGNHDPIELFRKHISSDTDRSIEYGNVRFVMFNNAHRDSHDGFITPQQLEWLESEFATATPKNQRVIVCCHVPIHANKHPDRGWYVKPDQGQIAFYQLRQRYSDQVLACFHGHFHNGIRGWRDSGKMVESLFPSVCYNQNRNMADHIASGAAAGFYVDELRPGYVLAELGNGSLILRYKPLGAELNGTYSAKWS